MPRHSALSCVCMRRSGRLLLSNMLIDYLASAEAFLADIVAEAGGTGTRNQLPPQPLSVDSETTYKAHCVFSTTLNC